MIEVELKLDEIGRGAFYAKEGNERLGEMQIAISGNDLTVFHTEVLEKAEGKGVASKMLETMVAYALTHHLMVIPLCPYVNAQFKRHPEKFQDVWKKKVNG
jgi:predicted GNAT family acetyltransferase